MPGVRPGASPSPGPCWTASTPPVSVPSPGSSGGSQAGRAPEWKPPRWEASPAFPLAPPARGAPLPELPFQRCRWARVPHAPIRAVLVLLAPSRGRSVDRTGGWRAPRVRQRHCRGWEAAHFERAAVLAPPGCGVGAVGRGLVSGGLQPTLRSQAVRRAAAWRAGGALLPNTKGLHGLGGSSGSRHCGAAPGAQGGGGEAEDQGSGSWGGVSAGWDQGQEGWAGVPLFQDAWWGARGGHLPSMTVMGSPVSIRRAPGSVTSLTQCASGGHAYREEEGVAGRVAGARRVMSREQERKEPPLCVYTRRSNPHQVHPLSRPGEDCPYSPAGEADPSPIPSGIRPGGQEATKGGAVSAQRPTGAPSHRFYSTHGSASRCLWKFPVSPQPRCPDPGPRHPSIPASSPPSAACPPLLGIPRLIPPCSKL